MSKVNASGYNVKRRVELDAKQREAMEQIRIAVAAESVAEWHERQDLKTGLNDVRNKKEIDAEYAAAAAELKLRRSQRLKELFVAENEAYHAELAQRGLVMQTH